MWLKALTSEVCKRRAFEWDQQASTLLDDLTDAEHAPEDEGWTKFVAPLFGQIDVVLATVQNDNHYRF
jgi:hypothetical protein